MDIFEKLADQLRGQDKTIVFPEGEDQIGRAHV